MNVEAKFTEISYEDCEEKGYSSGVNINGVGCLYAKIFQGGKITEYWLVDKNGAVRQIERKHLEEPTLNWCTPAEKKDITVYLDTGKRYW